MIDIEQIIEQSLSSPEYEYHEIYKNEHGESGTEIAIKEVLKLAIPEILEEVANKAEIKDIPEEFSNGYYSIIDKNSITSLSESLIEKYTK